MAMTLKETLAQLEKLGDERTRKLNTKQGVGDNQYGVKLGELRKLSKKIKSGHALALELWETGNFDARMLAVLLLKPEELSADALDAMVRQVNHTRVADWLNAYVVKSHPGNESLRRKWMTDQHPMALRAGWELTAQRVAKEPAEVDIPALLDRITNEMADAPPEAQWTMNVCLAQIGIIHPGHRQQALDIGERLGIYRDYPVSKGCTSPYAPVWINEMVSRQEGGK